jgi:hypothetical protein
MPPNPTPDIGEDLKIMVEIVSGRHLLVGDRTSSDPYVIVKLGEKEVHRTKYISKTYVSFSGIFSGICATVKTIMCIYNDCLLFA